MDLDGEILGETPLWLALDLVEKRRPNREQAPPAKLAENFPIVRVETRAAGHETNLDIVSNVVNPCPIGLFVEDWDDPRMIPDLWPKRGLFREWVAEAKAKLGATNNAEVAPIMGIAPTSLNKYLGRSETHKPSDEALKKLGDFLGRDYRVLLDDPEHAPPGVDPKRWAELTEKKRVLMSAMLEDLLAIPEGEEDAYFALWKQGQAIGRARREQETKTGGRSAPKK